ncbi:hypothetical protein [Dysgonomonas sp. 521]|uniref:hypothetical protein n=1 Tax=Dysgonomonas sp. 521 TaxID=2302932 RepID=UPI0013D77D58|nr:hypothetical protein [Dysgonomonas sp. 521]
MKKYLFFSLFLLFTIPSFSQDIKIDILDVYPAIIDNGSVRNEDGKIYLKVHKAESEELRRDPLAVVPDEAYVKNIMDGFSVKLATIMDGLKDKMEADIMAYVQSQPDPEKIDPEALNKYIMDYALSVARTIFIKDFNFSEEMASYVSTTVFQKSKVGTVSFNLAIDCNRNILEYKSIIFNFADGGTEELQLSDEKRSINESDPKGFAYRIFERMCSQQDL